MSEHCIRTEIGVLSNHPLLSDPGTGDGLRWEELWRRYKRKQQMIHVGTRQQAGVGGTLGAVHL